MSSTDNTSANSNNASAEAEAAKAAAKAEAEAAKAAAKAEAEAAKAAARAAAKSGVKAKCIRKRQWEGRIIRPGDGEIFDFPKGIPAGYEDFFKPI